MAGYKESIMSRYFVLGVFVLMVSLIILIYAGFIMFAEAEYWEKVAKRFRSENLPIPPVRGNILSADGKLMASSIPEYTIFMDYFVINYKRNAKSAKSRRADSLACWRNDSTLKANLPYITKELHKILPGKSEAYFKNRIEKGLEKRFRHDMLYPGKISYQQFKKINELFTVPTGKKDKDGKPKTVRIRGFHYETDIKRDKPFNTLAKQTLGEIFSDSVRGTSYGLENSFDSILKGKPGIKHRKKVTSGFEDFIDKPAINGADLITTIDVRMQDIAEKSLREMLEGIGADLGTAILMEVATGDIKAIANLTRNSDGTYSERGNHALTYWREPGSTFKTASIMVALEDGKISVQDTVDTGNGRKYMHGAIMRDHNWVRGGYQKLSVPEIMMKSSNIGVATLIDDNYGKDPGKFVEGLYRLGLKEPLHLQLTGIPDSDIRHPKDKTARGWYGTALPWMSIGYETRITPIQMVTFYNAIANNGKMVKPRFVTSVVHGGKIIEEYPVEVINPSICSQSTLDKIKRMLEQVVGEKGLGKQAASTQFTSAGKTGTAQIPHGTAGYKAGMMRYLVSFAGYFPADNPRYSCIVIIQKPGLPASGGLMAGPVFRNISERVYAKILRQDYHIATDTNNVKIPAVKSGNLDDARYILDKLNIQAQANYSNHTKKQVFWGRAEQTPEVVKLHPQDMAVDLVPNVIGMGAKDALYLLESKGLKVKFAGMGKVKRQSLAQGMSIKKGESIILTLDTR